MISRSILKRQFRLPVLIVAALSISYGVVAQTDLTLESSKMQLAYKNPAFLSFDVKYKYALESDSTTILDSTTASFKISGTFYYGFMDSTEYMQNSSYAVVLYKDAKLMRISNPTTVYPQIANFSSLDSIIGKNNYTTALSASGSNKTITMTFSGSSYPYKSFKVTYDSVTHFVKRIVYVIREEFDDYTDSYSRSATGSTSPYAVFTMEYSNYQTSSFSTTIFNSGNYFLLSGSNYVPQPPYDDYQVSIASPNLIK